MQQEGLRASVRRRFRYPGGDGTSTPVVPNILDRQFQVDVPNHSWVADITYIPVAEGWLYLAAIMDLYSRRIVA